jgi:hypothetical protein
MRVRIQPFNLEPDPVTHFSQIFTCEYLRKFSKRFEMTLVLFSGAWWRVIHENNLKQKIL